MATYPAPDSVAAGKGSATEGVGKRIAEWAKNLQAYRQRITLDPQFNPIKQLAFDLSRALEAEALDQKDLVQAAKELCDRALIGRAYGLRRYIGTVEPAECEQKLRGMVRDSAFKDGQLVAFEAFAERWQRPAHGVVFTAHPTFVMSERLREVLVRLVETPTPEIEAQTHKALEALTHGPDPYLDLKREHNQVQAAIGNAQEAVRRVNRVIFDVARELYPQAWWRLRPHPVVLSSWVGYDLDGRTDIHWHDSLKFRLIEKRIQLERYRETVRQIRPDISNERGAHDALEAIAARIAAEINNLHHIIALLEEKPGNAGQISCAANQLTRERTGLKNAIAPAAELLEDLIGTAEHEKARTQLLLLMTDLKTLGLGTARIHIRINAAQLHNAIRKPLGIEGTADLGSRTLLKRLDEMCETADAQTVNFASLAIEPTTAVRQFILMAQILKHVDSEAPIRLLIAECEYPATVLSALYFARLFGIADKVDISPLLETPAALDHGARIFETLLKTKSYRTYVAQRGRLSVQAGYSDAGRFLGQIPAALEIERLHGKLADVVARAAPKDAELLIFDTHGESMGRGGHPVSLRDRLDYVMSPWARARFAQRGLRLHHETSFQGGDGYLLFGSPNLAFAVITEILQSEPDPDPAVLEDPFYVDFDFSHDFFERVKTFQARLFEDRNYRTTLSAFGTNLLPKSGSRTSKRQYDAPTDTRSVPAEMRAIPHNAILQQFSYLVNVVSGIGSALRHDRERFADIYRASDRVQRLLKMVAHARRLSSIKTIVAYASLFDDAFWVTRPIAGMEAQIKEPSLYLADLLRGDPRHDGMMHLATFLRKDAIYLYDLMCDVDLRELTPPGESRLELDLLHAIRIAMIQHIYLLAARVPPFSARNDITRADIMKLILSLRIEEALDMLTEAFPRTMPRRSDYSIEEPASYTGEEGSDYGEIHRCLIDPIREAFKIVRQISVGISHHYGAHG